MSANIQYCRTLFQQRDRLAFTAMRLLPDAALRDVVAVLHALNIETAGIGEKVLQKEFGEIRAGFWKQGVAEAIASSKGVPLGGATGAGAGAGTGSSSASSAGDAGFRRGAALTHPVIAALGEVFPRLGGDSALAGMFLHRLVDARQRDMMMVRPRDNMPELEKYAEHTYAGLLYLKLLAAGTASVDMDHIASHIGKAHGIALVLRGTMENAKRGRLYVPASVLAKHKVSEEDFFRGNVTEKMRDAVFDVADTANGHVSLAREHLRDLSGSANRNVRLLFLPALVYTETYLAALEKQQFDPFHPDPVQSTSAWRIYADLYKQYLNILWNAPAPGSSSGSSSGSSVSASKQQEPKLKCSK